jgi:hypothetical protein
VLTILRAIVLAMSCLVALSGPAPGGQWDDLAQRVVDQEHARLVRRAVDKDDIVIVMEHRLVTERIVLVVTDNKPVVSFQFKSATLPGNDAFELMARASSLVTGKDVAIAMACSANPARPHARRSPAWPPPARTGSPPPVSCRAMAEA